jgi:hypothetical protein
MTSSPHPAGPRPSSAPRHNPARVVVVVPRKETRLHEYLRRSLAAIEDVEVVLDRRATRVPPADERRHSTDAEHRILICSLVRCPPRPTPRSH